MECTCSKVNLLTSDLISEGCMLQLISKGIEGEYVSFKQCNCKVENQSPKYIHSKGGSKRERGT